MCAMFSDKSGNLHHHVLFVEVNLMKKAPRKEGFSVTFLFCFLLLGDEQEVVFLAALHEEVLATEEVGGSDHLVESGQFFFVEADAAALCGLAHLAL